MPKHNLVGYEQYPHHPTTVLLQLEDNVDVSNKELDELAKMEAIADRNGLAQLDQDAIDVESI